MDFLHFQNRLLAWIEESGVFFQLEYHLRSHLTQNRKTLDPRVYWAAALIELDPPEHVFWLASKTREITHLAERLSSETYPNKKNLSQLAEHSYLKLEGYERNKGRIELLYRLQIALLDFINGTFSRDFEQDPVSAFEKIRNDLAFSDEWQLSTWLFRLGFLWPSSKKAYLGWLKYSGEPARNRGPLNWRNLLKSVSQDPSKQVRIDYLLNFAFDEQAAGFLPTLCSTNRSCEYCCLRAECHYYKNTVKTDSISKTSSLLKLQETKDLEVEDLLIFLQRNWWNQSELQKRLFKDYPSVPTDLFSQKGLNPDDEEVVLNLLALKEITDRAKHKQPLKEGTAFTGSQTVFERFGHLAAKDQQESFYCLLLDNALRIIRLQMITRGILDSSLVHPREVFAPAIQLRAAAMVLIHNHPGGNATPSKQDKKITQRLHEVAKIVGIEILDHVIIGENDHFSFTDNGLMPSTQPKSSRT